MAEATVDKPPDDRARLLALFSGDTKHNDTWSKLWDKGDFLPWDRGTPNPALEDILLERQGLIGDCFVPDDHGRRRRKKALVPGCGRGYDVLLLASFGYDAYGLEVSYSAVQRCRREQEINGHKYPIRNKDAGEGRVEFLMGDFFGDSWTNNVDGGPIFELIYDYTFFCALAPSLRPKWSTKMFSLLGPAPQGRLLCIEFPTYKAPSSGGPPHASPPEVYLAHLGQPGKEIPYDENGHVKQEAVDTSDAAGLERLAHWQPARTHEIGKDTDWISIWQHR